MLAVLLAFVCFALPPVHGPVTEQYAPSDRYAGHWGIDLAAPPGSEVRAPVDGVVSFAGTVAGMRTVTVRAIDGTRVSMSYLSVIEVTSGSEVAAGDAIGLSGRAHGRDLLHVSVRQVNGYVNPLSFLQCQGGTIRLLPDRFD